MQLGGKDVLNETSHRLRSGSNACTEQVAIDPAMAGLFHALLGAANVAVISGGDWPPFEKQVLANLPPGDYLAALSILPTCGTKFFRYAGRWAKLYAEDFTAEEKAKIESAFHQAIQTSGFKVEKVWDDTIEDCGSQITYSALGQQAPLKEKAKWDPDFAKRQKIKVTLDKLLGGFSVRLGGTTSIDVTKPGIDKAYGIDKLALVLGISKAQMVYVGDAIFPGGNDYAAKQAGVLTISVRDPDETKKVIETIIACLS